MSAEPDPCREGDPDPDADADLRPSPGVSQPDPSPLKPHRRRPRYPGRNPRRFEDKYKEHDPERHAEVIAKVVASGKTPAGTHRPILVAEVLEVLAVCPGERFVDGTLGYGGHARAILGRLAPGGHLLGLDADPVELPKTERRLREAGFGPDVFTAVRSNFAGLPQALAQHGWVGVDGVLVDLGVSSMQLDDPARGFTAKFEGPLDMRMNPGRGQSAAAYLASVKPGELERILDEYSDEPRARFLGGALAGRRLGSTRELAEAIRTVLGNGPREEVEATVRRVFQALRIAVNDEFSALETLLRHLPGCLNPGGRVAVLTFHSGEDRRVKHAFAAGLASGVYSAVADEVIRPGPEERRSNSRSSSAKLRWAMRAPASGGGEGWG
ncbi:MAG: 16S rRNA (cytosine(1402)-N(4))-methyltransferase RsmH [Limisphaerales bacterium]